MGSVGRRDEIGLMRANEIEHRAQRRRIIETVAQDFGREPRQREQPRGAIGVRQNPSESRECQHLGVG
jgi:hypothetical protein